MNSRLNVMFWRLFGKFTLLFTFLETGSYHLPSCQCLRVGPTRVRTKKVQKGTASGGTPPTSFRSPKKYVGGVYFTWSGEIFLRNFLPYPPPNIPGIKGGDALYLTDPCGHSLLQHGQHAGWAISKKRCHVEDDNRICVGIQASWEHQGWESWWHDIAKTWNMQNIVFSGKTLWFSRYLRFQGFWKPLVCIIINSRQVQARECSFFSV